MNRWNSGALSRVVRTLDSWPGIEYRLNQPWNIEFLGFDIDWQSEFPQRCRSDRTDRCAVHSVIGRVFFERSARTTQSHQADEIFHRRGTGKGNRVRLARSAERSLQPSLRRFRNHRLIGFDHVDSRASFLQFAAESRRVRPWLAPAGRASLSRGDATMRPPIRQRTPSESPSPLNHASR